MDGLRDKMAASKNYMTPQRIALEVDTINT